MESKLVIECLGFEADKSYGFQEYLFNLLSYMYKHREDLRYSQVIIACKPSQVKSFNCFSSKFIIRGIKGSESYWGRLWHQLFLPWQLLLNRSDTILFPGNFSGCIKKCHYVLVIHDLLYKRSDLTPDFRFRLQREIFVGPSVRIADRIICISNFVANDVMHYFPKSSDKVVPIYNYMNFTKYKCGVKLEDEGYFIAVAANSYHKDLSTIFRAYSRYRSIGGSLDLVLVGKISDASIAGQTYSSLDKATQEHISIKGNISNSDLGVLYQNASAFISASRFEGFGMPVAEAMFFNLPLLLSDIEIHREVSLNKGLFFSPGDDVELASLMSTAQFKRIDYGADLIGRYDEENTSAKYVQLLNEFTVTN